MFDLLQTAVADGRGSYGRAGSVGGVREPDRLPTSRRREKRREKRAATRSTRHPTPTPDSGEDGPEIDLYFWATFLAAIRLSRRRHGSRLLAETDHHPKSGHLCAGFHLRRCRRGPRTAERLRVEEAAAQACRPMRPPRAFSTSWTKAGHRCRWSENPVAQRRSSVPRRGNDPAVRELPGLYRYSAPQPATHAGDLQAGGQSGNDAAGPSEGIGGHRAAALDFAGNNLGTDDRPGGIGGIRKLARFLTIRKTRRATTRRAATRSTRLQRHPPRRNRRAACRPGAYEDMAEFWGLFLGSGTPFVGALEAAHDDDPVFGRLPPLQVTTRPADAPAESILDAIDESQAPLPMVGEPGSQVSSAAGTGTSAPAATPPPESFLDYIDTVPAPQPAVSTYAGSVQAGGQPGAETGGGGNPAAMTPSRLTGWPMRRQAVGNRGRNDMCGRWSRNWRLARSSSASMARRSIRRNGPALSPPSRRFAAPIPASSTNETRFGTHPPWWGRPESIRG